MMDKKTNLTQQSQSYKLIWILAFAMVISVMNSTMFNVALPDLRVEFGLTSSQVSWVVTAYIIIYAIGSVTYGKLADMFKLKNLITFGLCCFAMGSLIGVLADSYMFIIVARILQSIGASVIPASSMLIPIRYVAEENRGRALGITSAGMALGTAIGPIIAGFVLSMASWRFLFAISILVLVTLPFFRKYLGNDKGVRGQADLPGGLLLAGVITLLMLAITRQSLLLLLLMLVTLVLFWIRMRRSSAPFISLELFKNKRYSRGLLIGSMVLTLNLCVPYLIPQMLTSLNQLSALQIGLVMSPGALFAALFGLLGGRITDKKGNRYLFSWAFGLQFIAYTLLYIFTGGSYGVVLFVLIAANTGLTFAQIALANTVSRTLPRHEAGVGMGVYMMCSFIAGAIGTTILGTTLDAKGASTQVFGSIYIFFGIWIVLSAVLFLFFTKKRVSESAST